MKMSFAILEQQKGRQHWVRIYDSGHDSFTSAIRDPLEHMRYADRETAERDAEVFRQRAVEAMKRKRKGKEPPASYTVVPIEPAETQ
jgi:hypothetical protein